MSPGPVPTAREKSRDVPSSLTVRLRVDVALASTAAVSSMLSTVIESSFAWKGEVFVAEGDGNLGLCPASDS